MKRVISVLCLLGVIVLPGCSTASLKEKQQAVEILNSTTTTVLEQNEKNTAIAKEKKDTVVNFLVKGAFGDDVQELIADEVKAGAKTGGAVDDVTGEVLEEKEYNWYNLTKHMDAVNTNMSNLRNDYEKRQGVFEENQITYNEYRDENGELQIDELVVAEPKWVFENPVIMEEGYYIAAGSGHTTQFLVIMGDENYKLVSKVHWKDGKIHMIERLLHE